VDLRTHVQESLHGVSSTNANSQLLDYRLNAQRPAFQTLSLKDRHVSK